MLESAMIELLRILVVVILIFLLGRIMRRNGDCGKEHKWKLKSSSTTFEYYECTRCNCNHSKGIHK